MQIWEVGCFRSFVSKEAAQYTDGVSSDHVEICTFLEREVTVLSLKLPESYWRASSNNLMVSHEEWQFTLSSVVSKPKRDCLV